MKRKRHFTVIGLTGGIGMGKSAAAKILRGLGLPVYEADKTVHALLRKDGKAAKPVAKLFPQSLKRGVIDRGQLARIVFSNAVRLRKLEKILHPLVRRAEDEFLRAMRKRKHPAAVLEIPLLFETGGAWRCDYVICVTAPKAVQKARVMKRRGMTEGKFKAICARQMPDRRKRALADFTVSTGGTYRATRKNLRSVLDRILEP